MRTLSQKRAEYALRFIIGDVLEKISKDKKPEEFANFVAGAPAAILKNGLGQTLAFWYQKGFSKGKENENERKYALLLNAIKKWLSLKEGDIDNNFIEERQEVKDFLLELSRLGQKEYQACQVEVLRLLEWIKRYANAELK